MTDNRRNHAREMIRLRVRYKTARSLVTEYTKSISKGGCLIESAKQLPVGTRFLFEMYAVGVSTPVEVEGEVVRAQPSAQHEGKFEIGVEYLTSEDKRAALETVLERIFADHQWEKSRKFPRIPVNLLAHDGRNATRLYLIRDISKGGLGLRLPAEKKLPDDIALGAPAIITVSLDAESPFEIRAHAAWTMEGNDTVTDAGVGLEFDEMTESEQMLVDLLTRLHQPAGITLTFYSGEDG